MRRYNSDFRTQRGEMESPIDRWYPQRSRSGSIDPNYRGGAYQGQRMHAGGAERAPYAGYRMTHAHDLGSFGGASGRYREAPARGGHGMNAGETEGGYGNERYFSPTYSGNARRGYGSDFGRSRGGGRYDRDYSAGGPSRARNTEAHGDPGRPVAQRRGYDQRGGERSGRQMQDASRALRYDGGFNTYGRANTGGFSDGYLGSGF